MQVLFLTNWVLIVSIPVFDTASFVVIAVLFHNWKVYHEVLIISIIAKWYFRYEILH